MAGGDVVSLLMNTVVVTVWTEDVGVDGTVPLDDKLAAVARVARGAYECVVDDAIGGMDGKDEATRCACLRACLR